MCGLVGMAGTIWLQEKKVFRDLLWLDQRRGEHSTGVAVVDKDNAVKLLKAVGTPIDLYRTNPENGFDLTDRTVKAFNLRALIGHNRWATVGAKTPDNAHPFHIGHVVGAHNGTLEAGQLWRLEDAKKFEVDSAAIIHNLDVKGTRPTIESLVGAWALVWYDQRDKQMHFIRNEKRPLSYCWSKDHTTIFWASEKWMLEIATKLNNIERGVVFEFMPDRHYTLDVSGDLKQAKLFYEKDKMEGFKRPPLPPVVDNHTNYPPKGHGHGGGPLANPFPPVNLGQKWDEKNPDRVMKKLVTTRVDFFVGGEKISPSGQPYLECGLVEPDLLNKEGINVRMYGLRHPRYDEWLKADGYFNGRVKKFVKKYDNKTHTYDSYILIDMRSVGAELPWAEEDLDKERTYEGYKNTELSYEQFIKATADGCIWCQDLPTKDTCDDLAWIDENQFMCPHCNAHDEALHYGSYIRGTTKPTGDA